MNCSFTDVCHDIFLRAAAVTASSHQQLAQLHEVEHVDLVHLGQLLAQLDGLLPHLRRHVDGSVTRGHIRPPSGSHSRNLFQKSQLARSGQRELECKPEGELISLPPRCHLSVPTHLALVQVAYDLLEEPLFQLLLGPHVHAIARYQVRGAGFVRPLKGETT